MRLANIIRIEDMRAGGPGSGRKPGFGNSAGMSHEDVHSKVFSGLTQHDQNQSTKPGWNPYALGHYARATQDIAEKVKGGMHPRNAVLQHLTGRVANVALKSIGETPATKEETIKHSW